MSKYNSVIDAIHASMDAFIEEGLLDASAKKMDAAGALHALNQALLNQEGASVSEDIAETNAAAEITIADQLGILLDIVKYNTVADNPLTALTVDTEIGVATDLLGKVVGDLQDDVTITNRTVSGDLLYVDDYTGFSGDPAEQHGHYLALHASVPNVDGVTIKFKGKKETTLDSDGIIIIIVDDPNRTISFTASKTGYADVTKYYSLSGLKLMLDDEA